MFLALSSHRWCQKLPLAPDAPLGPSSGLFSSLELRPDGKYDKFIADDVLGARPPSPLWNFEKLGARDGILFLTGEADVVFVLFRFLSADQLQATGLFPGVVRTQTFDRCQPLKIEGAHTVAGLPKVELGKQVERLAGTTWFITSDISGAPRAIRFEPNGTVLLQLPPSECDLPDDRTAYLGSIVEQLPDGGCWKQIAYEGSLFHLSGRFLVHQQTPYVRDKDRSERRHLWFSFGSVRVEGVISYDPPFWRTPRPLTVELWALRQGAAIDAILTIAQRIAGPPNAEYKDIAVVPLKGVSFAGTPLVRPITIDSFPDHTHPSQLRLTYREAAGRESAPEYVYPP